MIFHESILSSQFLTTFKIESKMVHLSVERFVNSDLSAKKIFVYLTNGFFTEAIFV